MVIATGEVGGVAEDMEVDTEGVAGEKLYG